MPEEPFVTCIGTRQVAGWLSTLCEAYGRFYAEQGFRVATGNARGADQAYALGADLVHPSLVDLYLPWPSYESKAVIEGNRIFLPEQATAEHRELAKEAHPTWGRLSSAEQRLMIRNAMAVRGMGSAPAAGVVALPNYGKPGLGGTGHGIRVAKLLRLPVLILPENRLLPPELLILPK